MPEVCKKEPVQELKGSCIGSKAEPKIKSGNRKLKITNRKV